MNTPDAEVRSEVVAVLRLECACDLIAVRAASLRVKDFLAAKGLGEELLGSLELALVEAANNTVEYVLPTTRDLPIRIEAIFGAREVELRIEDHTAGFDWPAQAELPDEESEGGRGIFLIQALVDRATYYRGRESNLLVLAKAHGLAASNDSSLPDSVESLRAQVEDLESTLTGMTDELSYSYETLTSIFRYSTELASTQDVGEFTGRLITDLVRLTEADVVVLRLFDKERKALDVFRTEPEDLATSWTSVFFAPAGPGVETEAALGRSDVWFDGGHPLAENDPLRLFGEPTVGICHPMALNNELLGTLTVARRLSEEPFRAAQVNLLQTLADFLAIQIANERYLSEHMRTQIVRRELDIAASIQRSLLPTKIPDAKPFTLTATCISAREVGGDLFDVIPVGAKGLLLVISDVMGKGIPAAMLAAILRSALRSMPHYFDQPDVLLNTLNRILYDDFSRVDMFATALVAYLDCEERKLSIASAGHCPLLIAQPGATQLTAIEASNMPLGVMNDTTYTAEHVILQPGARAILYTDGITEQSNADDELFDEPRLREWLLHSEGQNAEVLKSSLLAAVDRFRGNEPVSDDQTFILITEGTAP
jgi:serine phosphatase RsbU (regulator of sigma subunit)/anti-sigma regulatory factor (Ser/Thr protein kinase)